MEDHGKRIYSSSSRGEIKWGDMNPKHLRNAAETIRRRARMLKGEDFDAAMEEADQMDAFAEDREKAWEDDHKQNGE